MSSHCAPSIDLTQVAADVVALIAQLRLKVEAQAREIALRDARVLEVLLILTIEYSSFI